MASGAGINRWGNSGGVTLLAGLGTATTSVATPLSGYGTINALGGNDSGGFGCAAMGFTKWVFQLLGNTANISVTIYGTEDPAAYSAFTTNSGQDGWSSPCPASSWFALPGPSEQSGTGAIANPLTSTTPLLVVSLPLVAVRAVVTAASAPTGRGSVVGFAAP